MCSFIKSFILYCQSFNFVLSLHLLEVFINNAERKSTACQFDSKKIISDHICLKKCKVNGKMMYNSYKLRHTYILSSQQGLIPSQ